MRDRCVEERRGDPPTLRVAVDDEADDRPHRRHRRRRRAACTAASGGARRTPRGARPTPSRPARLRHRREAPARGRARTSFGHGPLLRLAVGEHALAPVHAPAAVRGRVAVAAARSPALEQLDQVRQRSAATGWISSSSGTSRRVEPRPPHVRCQSDVAVPALTVSGPLSLRPQAEKHDAGPSMPRPDLAIELWESIDVTVGSGLYPFPDHCEDVDLGLAPTDGASCGCSTGRSTGPASSSASLRRYFHLLLLDMLYASLLDGMHHPVVQTCQGSSTTAP